MARIIATACFWTAAFVVGVMTACSGSSQITLSDAAIVHTGVDAGRDGGAAGGAGGSAGGIGGRSGAACTATTRCRNGMICNTATGACVECLSTSDCGTQKCDLASQTCVDCLASTDCPTGMPVCSGGHTCGGMCSTSANCQGALPVCETATHACVECLTGADCGPGGVCQTDLTCG